MSLTELDPRWVNSKIFAFLCPHCKNILLSCKNAPMTTKEQREVFELVFGDDWNDQIIMSRNETVWSFVGAVESLTIDPSVDASPSGHWHGRIINGVVT